MSTDPHHPDTSRIEAFSDGVIAIVLTIMVLDLRPPGSQMNHDVLSALLDYLSPRLTVYALSFVLVAKMWISHHQLMHAASHVTTRLMWLNNLLLFWMSLVPFATGYLSEDAGRPLAVATYGTVMCLTAATFTLLRQYIIANLLREGRVVHPRLIPLSLISTALYAAGAMLAFVSVYASFALFVMEPFLSVQMDRYLHAPAVN